MTLCVDLPLRGMDGERAEGGATLARWCVWGTHPQVRILLPSPFGPVWSSGKTRGC